ncbi:MAG: substrate-binding domain-containing protein, partial [Lachnospiraceae bacterium]
MNYKKGICFLLSVFLLTGCATADTQSEKRKNHENSKIQIGMTLDSKVLERWVRDVDVFVAEAKKSGAEVDVQSANGDVSTQKRQIDNYIKEKKDVIVIIAADCNALSEVVKRAHDAGIKIVSYDRLIEDAPSDLYISFDNAEVGSLMAEEVKKELPKGGSIIMICGPKSDGNALMIEKAFRESIKGTKLNVVRTDYAKGWTAEYAFQVVDEALADINEIDGVMCGNDALAVQAVNALAEKQLAGKVCVVGQDADVEACQKVVEGLQSMTVYKDVDLLAKTAAQYSVMLAQELDLTG